jgi:hypothetical protein
VTDHLEVELLGVERFERDVRLRLPFRFGVTTVTHAKQAVIRANVAVTGIGTSFGVAAETLAAKWFDKNVMLSDDDNFNQLRQSLEIAIELYGAQGRKTPFELFSSSYYEQLARGASFGLNPLVSSYGPALLDRAIADAFGRAHGRSFPELISANLIGMHAGITPDLAGLDLSFFLQSLRMSRSIAVRHTVGLVDPITAADQAPGERINDGLPETLEEVVRRYRGRYYKLKVGGTIGADLDRLMRIAAVLDNELPAYRVTLDGNEQYDSVDEIAELWRRMRDTPKLKKLTDSILFLEQPIKRTVALNQPVESLARHVPIEIDESDGELSSFPAAIELGYTGCSSKTSKGFYKSILNAARVARLNAHAGEPRFFMSAEDLTTWPGVSVQQDLCLIALLGIGHVERNSYHFIDGMSFAPQSEQKAFAEAHPDLYEENGTTRLRIVEGQLAIGSLDCVGFANKVDPAFSSMEPMPDAPRSRIRTARGTSL